tara:strand:- start:675 stop:1436 length:762 start_codon:yes stop_codon:yes gene_type:complete
MNIYVIILIFLSSFFASETIGVVMKHKGDVDYIPYDKNKQNKKINISESLFNQDLIKTGKDGFTKFVYLDDGSAIKIHKDSEVYIQGDIDKRKIIKQINISKGKLKLDVQNQQLAEFKIITPTSVASIKGTRFWVDVNGKKGDVFHGLSGIVEITNNITGNKIELTENTTATSLPDGTLEIKKTINRELIQLEVLEEEVGEPVNDMPNNDVDDDSGSLLEDNINNGVLNTNELVIRLKNASSDEKIIIIKFVD